MTTTSHKGIGILYFYSGWLGGFFGFYLSIWIRLEMNFQGLAIVRKVKELHFYNHVISVHGLVMLFAFIMPVAIGGYGNLLLPVYIGSAELTMPRLNGVSYWFYFMGVFTLVLAGFFFEKPICAGWTLYPPLSTRDSESSSVSTDLGIFTLHLLGLSSALGSFNFVSMAKHQRHVGLALIGVNIYVWAIIITSLLLIGALPILGVGLTGLLLDRNFATSIYDGVLGGDPVLFQHLFLTLYIMNNNNKNNETNFHFTSFKKRLSLYYKDHHINKEIPSDEFLSWLVGFSEGDGCFTVNNRKELSFIVTQGQANLQLLEGIYNKINLGHIIKQGPRVYRLIIQKREELTFIILLFNGNIVLPSRKIQFHKFLLVYNSKVKNSEVLYRNGHCLPSYKNLWILGFTEAEGCFTVSFLSNSNAFRTRYIVSQKGDINLPILSEFIHVFKTGCVEGHSVKNHYSYIVSSLNNVQLIYPYFDANISYFMGIKRESYLKFKELNHLILQFQHLDPSSRPLLNQLAQEINGVSRKVR